MAFTYRLSDLRGSKSGWWIVAHNEFAAKAEAFLIAEGYESYRVRCMSVKMIRNMLRHDLVQFLGSCSNVEELERFLLVMERINIKSLLYDWSCQGEGLNLAPGSRGSAGYYLFYNALNERALAYSQTHI